MRSDELGIDKHALIRFMRHEFECGSQPLTCFTGADCMVLSEGAPWLLDPLFCAL